MNTSYQTLRFILPTAEAELMQMVVWRQIVYVSNQVDHDTIAKCRVLYLQNKFQGIVVPFVFSEYSPFENSVLFCSQPVLYMIFL